MSEYKLRIMDAEGQDFIIDLEDSQRGYSIEALLNSPCYIYSDRIYRLRLLYEDVKPEISFIYVYINNEFQRTSIIGEDIFFFKEHSMEEKPAFGECYGVITIELRIVLKDGTYKELSTHKLPVIVPDNVHSRTMIRMIEYIFKNEAELLKNDIIYVPGKNDLEYGGSHDLISQLEIVEEIAAVYEENYSYFKANSRFNTTKAENVERIEKLQFATSRTVRYVVRHPEEMRASVGSHGIRVGGKYYIPERTLITRNIYTKDIYENRTILSFLRYIQGIIKDLKDNAAKLISMFPSASIFKEGYYYSPQLFYQQIVQVIQKNLTRIDTVSAKISELYAAYSRVFEIDDVQPMNKLPDPTGIFLAVPQYNKMFLCIYKWFNYGTYQFETELFVASAMNISDIYELYILVCLLKSLKELGFNLVRKSRYDYTVSEQSKHKNPFCKNTFVFESELDFVTVYYQPVIYTSYSRENNGIRLYRNNTRSISNDGIGRNGYYYVPDFIIKAKHGEQERYLICDAKYTSKETVLWKLFPDLTYKYLFSISPKDMKAKIVGLNIIYALCSEKSEQESIYNAAAPAMSIDPVAELTPLSIDMSEEQTKKMIERILESMLK